MDGYLIAGIVLAIVAVGLFAASCANPDLMSPVRMMMIGGGDKGSSTNKGSGGTAKGAVTSLSSAAEFDEVLSGRRGKAMLLLYSDGCVHCHRMMPDFEKAAAAETSKKSGVVFARMSSKHGSPELFQRLKVSGVPALYAVKGSGSYDTHVGARNQEAIAAIAGGL
jgi:thioredoxin-like negative regulator of GroEL